MSHATSSYRYARRFRTAGERRERKRIVEENILSHNENLKKYSEGCNIFLKQKKEEQVDG